MISFNTPPNTGNEQQYVLQAIASPKMSGDGPFGEKCQAWFEETLPAKKTLLTPSAVFNPVVHMTAFKQPVYCAQFPAAFQD